MSLQISQLANETGLSIHTLRYYEKEGILPPVKRSENGIRIYDSEDIEWIKFACCLRETGMGIAEMKKFAQLVIQGDESKNERIKLLRQQNTRTKDQIEQLTRCMELINRKIELYSSPAGD
ncbi:MerR family transcriptional regulator [Paenibacillus agricola]|uniref:MerR family transcriptional regulator n=1 Tax=Paenibacillus agricola TaxID=2716264 RepID=A0ABX0JBY5_9BACL|nr:MerR family transcriptional regulator [Paenibacillus agricola]NHN32749.1 MerR family transcriptional regulator [Paenibacillus agricola]